MRIAFVGKGGSGKTTTASLYARYAYTQGQRVLALDADINQHLALSLGYDGTLPSMGLELDTIKRYLRGDNQRFSAEDMNKTTPPGSGSRFVTLAQDDWFVRRYARSSDGIYVAGAGEIPEGNVGVKCYHGLNGAIELVLGHMCDTPSDTVIVDMTAGADAFSSTLFAKVDALVLVVEPTLKSLSVYEQFLPNIQKYRLPFFVIANKLVDDSDSEFIAQTIPVLVAELPSSPYVRARERGQKASMEPTLMAELGRLHSALMAVPRDWGRLEALSHELHIKNAESWAGAKLREQIDPDFSLAEYMQSLA